MTRGAPEQKHVREFSGPHNNAFATPGLESKRYHVFVHNMTVKNVNSCPPPPVPPLPRRPQSRLLCTDAPPSAAHILGGRQDRVNLVFSDRLVSKSR
jgi:hypothetical protein